MLKICPYSGKEFLPKRRDQVFASSVNRRAWHNEIEAQKRQVQADIKLLRKNFNILDGLDIPKDGRKSFSKDFLLQQGYVLDAISRLVFFENTTLTSVFGYILLKSSDGKTITIVNKTSKP